MENNVDPYATQDDIDRIVDALLKYPERSSDLKALLRSKIAAPNSIHVARAVAQPAPTGEDDSEGFWDNVPV